MIGEKKYTTILEEVNCPIPATHDRLSEAHYFLHQMLDNFHFPYEFRFSLNAFLQSLRSTKFVLDKEAKNRDRKTVAPKLKSWDKKLNQDPIMHILINKRDFVVHQGLIMPLSKASIGWFKYGRFKLGMKMDVSPEMSSLSLLHLARTKFQDFGHPHRMWDGEEFGIQREWRLSDLPDTEIFEVCVKAWELTAEMVADAHVWFGANFSAEAKCKHNLQVAQILLESEVFPEVTKAWAFSPANEVRPKGNEVPLMEKPTSDGSILHVIKKNQVAIGWVGTSSRYVPSRYFSMLVYKIDSKVISKNTAVFFKSSDADVREIWEIEESKEDGKESD